MALKVTEFVPSFGNDVAVNLPIRVVGEGFVSGAKVRFERIADTSPDFEIIVNNAMVVDSDLIAAEISYRNQGPLPENNTVIVKNPSGAEASLDNAFTAYPAPE